MRSGLSRGWGRSFSSGLEDLSTDKMDDEVPDGRSVKRPHGMRAEKPQENLRARRRFVTLQRQRPMTKVRSFRACELRSL